MRMRSNFMRNRMLRKATKREDLSLPCIDHDRDDQGDEGDVTKAVPTPHHEQGGGE